jgi:nitrite reductase/ring-hydroxylating ferredoxin subunit
MVKKNKGPILDFSALDSPPQPTLFKAVCRVKELYKTGQILKRVGLKSILIIAYEEEILAINAFCPHAGGKLSLGRIKEGIITCPRHQWQFEVHTGDCPEHPNYRLRTFPTEIRDGEVFVGITPEF